MYATTSRRDAYRKFRAKAPSFLYAFGQQEFMVFVMGDALKLTQGILAAPAAVAEDPVRLPGESQQRQ